MPQQTYYSRPVRLHDRLIGNVDTDSMDDSAINRALGLRSAVNKTACFAMSWLVWDGEFNLGLCIVIGSGTMLTAHSIGREHELRDVQQARRGNPTLTLSRPADDLA